MPSYRAILGGRKTIVGNPKAFAGQILTVLPATLNDTFQLGLTKVFLREVGINSRSFLA